MVKMVNGETRGMFILSAEPKELTIVLILGPVRMEDLGRLKGIGGLGRARRQSRCKRAHKAKTRTRPKTRTKDKDKTKGGTE